MPLGSSGIQDLSGIPSPFPVDMLKKVIREYKDVYSEIVNQAGKTLQQVGVFFWAEREKTPARLTLCYLQVFGLQLVEIDTKHHIYILTSNLPRAEGENLHR